MLGELIPPAWNLSTNSFPAFLGLSLFALFLYLLSEFLANCFLCKILPLEKSWLQTYAWYYLVFCRKGRVCWLICSILILCSLRIGFYVLTQRENIKMGPKPVWFPLRLFVASTAPIVTLWKGVQQEGGWVVSLILARLIKRLTLLGFLFLLPFKARSKLNHMEVCLLQC